MRKSTPLVIALVAIGGLSFHTSSFATTTETGRSDNFNEILTKCCSGEANCSEDELKQLNELIKKTSDGKTEVQDSGE